MIAKELVPERPLGEQPAPLSEQEVKRCEVWLDKVHRGLGHKPNAHMVRMLRYVGAHPQVVKMAEDFKCDACQEAKRPVSRRVIGTISHVPGRVGE